MRYIIIFILFISPLVASAQKVVDATNGEPIAGAAVQLLDSLMISIDYRMTNADGGFSAFEKNGKYLKFSAMNYRNDTIGLSNLPSVISLSPQSLNLREITVNAPKIRSSGDTLSYNVDSFATQSDRSIGDVLRRMPGIEVSETGQIKYNGEAINKFYIEGADMMDSRYGVATNSILYEDVAGVDIMENHQPIKALENVAFSDKAALNLRLKESAKARWVGSVEGGGGVPQQYMGELSAMSFARRFQTLNTLKANNTGDDVTSETSATSIMELITKQDNGGELSDYITIAPGRVSRVDTHFGNNQSASSNFLSKISEDSEIKGNVTFANSHFSYLSERATTYFLQDSTINILEQENSTEHARAAAANLTLTTNSKEFYLRNTLKADFADERIGVHTLGTYPNIQQGDIFSTEISNNFELIKRMGDRTLNISSYNGYASKPQELVVVGDSGQRVEASAFSSNTKATYSFRSGYWNIFTGAGVHYYAQKINGFDFGYLKACLTPRAEYRSRGDFIFTVSAPMDYYLDKNFFMPSLTSYAKLPISARSSLTANAGVRQSPISNSNFYAGVIYNDYRTMSYGVTDFLPLKSIYGSLGFSYKDPLTLLFANGNVGYSRNISPYMSSQSFEGGYIINSFIAEKSYNFSISSNLSIGKGYRGGRVSLGVNYGLANGKSLQNGSMLNYTLHQAGANLKASAKITQWLSAEYIGQYQISTLDKFTTSNWLLDQSANVVSTPVKGVHISIRGSYLTTENSNLMLLGASAQWKINKAWEMSIEASNLLDESHYLVEILSGTQFVSTRYNIRPRSIMGMIALRF